MLDINALLHSIALLLVLINPLLLVIYLTDMVQKLDQRQFNQVLLRAGFIAFLVFCFFAILGDMVFVSLLQADFASFQIFGGIVFFLIGLQFVFRGPTALEILRGESRHLAGAVAMPVLIGPGSISASVVIGKRHEPLLACLIVLIAIAVSMVALALLKTLHDHVRPRNEELIQRYIEIAGRVMALYVGTIAVDMVMRGLQGWADKF